MAARHVYRLVARNDIMLGYFSLSVESEYLQPFPLYAVSPREGDLQPKVRINE